MLCTAESVRALKTDAHLVDLRRCWPSMASMTRTVRSKTALCWRVIPAVVAWLRVPLLGETVGARLALSLAERMLPQRIASQ